MAHEVKKYMKVFSGLLILTVVTVSVSNLKIGVTLGVIVALIIATIKGGLVAAHFMHLNAEKKVIYFVLILTAIFFFFLMFLTCFMYFDIPQGAHHVA